MGAYRYRFADDRRRRGTACQGRRRRSGAAAHDAMKFAYANRDKYLPEWDEIKLGVMKKILHAKVAQHPYVRKKLLESGDPVLIHDSWRDAYWGWGPNKDGEDRKRT